MSTSPANSGATFVSPLASKLLEFLAQKHAMGYRYREEGRALRELDCFLHTRLAPEDPVITLEIVHGYLVNGNLIAVIATIQSGDVFNMGTNRLLNGDPLTPSTFQRPLFIGRNTLRAPRTSEFNVRYTRLFPVGERMKLEFIAESTNIFNRTNSSWTEQHSDRRSGRQHSRWALVGPDGCS